jgi:Arc/MetJ-type ribon-helix-helix transcriptional regulator
MIEIKPEVKAAIETRLQTGRFHDVDELLMTALSKLPEDGRFASDVRREAVRRMKEFSRESKLSLGEPVTRDLLHEGHRF